MNTKEEGVREKRKKIYGLKNFPFMLLLVEDIMTGNNTIFSFKCALILGFS